jgi:hypothetical protein
MTRDGTRQDQQGGRSSGTLEQLSGGQTQDPTRWNGHVLLAAKGVALWIAAQACGTANGSTPLSAGSGGKTMRDQR